MQLKKKAKDMQLKKEEAKDMQLKVDMQKNIGKEDQEGYICSLSFL